MTIRRTLIGLVGAVAIGCGAGGGGSGASSGPATAAGTPPVVLPDGDDSLIPLAVYDASAEHVLYSAMTSDARFVYACTAAHGLHVLRVPAPDRIELAGAGTFSGSGGCREVTRVGETLVVTGQGDDGNAWITEVPAGDAIARTGPLPEGARATPPALVEHLIATDTHVFAALGEAGVIVYGRGDGALVELDRVPQGFDAALGLALWGDTRLLVANGLGGVVVLDASDPSHLAIERAFRTNGTARRVQVVDGLAYVARVKAGITVHDLAQPDPWPALGSWASHSATMALDVRDGTLFAANWEDLCVLDASDPSHLGLAGTEVLAGAAATSRVLAVEGRGDHAIALEWSSVWSVGYGAGRSAPDIRLAKARLDFGLVLPATLGGIAKWEGKALVIANTGTKPLTISEVSPDNPRFTVEASDAASLPRVLEPGDKVAVDILFTPETADTERGALTIRSDDPDEATLTVPLTANASDAIQVGAKFAQDPPLTYEELSTASSVSVETKYPGKVVLLAHFASW